MTGYGHVLRVAAVVDAPSSVRAIGQLNVT